MTRSDQEPNPQRQGGSSKEKTRRRIKGVIFDIDGTLANSWKLGFDATNVVLEKHQIAPISTETYHHGTKYTTPQRLARHAGLSPNDVVAFESRGNQLAAEFDDLYIGLVSMETAGFYNGIYNLLMRIRTSRDNGDAVKLGALTNAAVGYAHAVLKINSQQQQQQQQPLQQPSSSLYERFEQGSIRGADTVAKAKPAPDGLWQVCRDDLQLEPDECVYIGDSPSDGVAALAAGMTFVGVTWGSHNRESLQTTLVGEEVFLCDTVAELEQWMASFDLLGE